MKTRHMPWCITAALVEPNQDDRVVVLHYGGPLNVTHNRILQHTMTAAAIANVFIEEMVGVKH